MGGGRGRCRTVSRVTVVIISLGKLAITPFAVGGRHLSKLCLKRKCVIDTIERERERERDSESTCSGAGMVDKPLSLSLI